MKTQVLGAFVHGDGNLLNQHPELQEALVWVYFHSNLPEFNKVECWGPLKDATAPSLAGAHRGEEVEMEMPPTEWELPEACRVECECCFPLMSSIQWSEELPRPSGAGGYGAQEGAGQQS